jgi:hypothetical protein
LLVEDLFFMNAFLLLHDVRSGEGGVVGCGGEMTGEEGVAVVEKLFDSCGL